VAPDYTIPALKDKTIFFGFGDYDFVQFRSLYSLFPDADGNPVKVHAATNEGSTLEYIVGLANAGVPFTNTELPFGHAWALWRKVAVRMFEDVLWK
jgi:hypothetical protein